MFALLHGQWAMALRVRSISRVAVKSGWSVAGEDWMLRSVKECPRH
jgi:hypothetical protein